MMISLQRLISRLSIALLFVFSVSVANAAEDKANGEKLFKANCTSCHELGKKKVGPDLTGVLSRWKDTKKLHAFIHDPTPFLKSDPYVKGLMEKMNGAVMSAQSINDKEIDDVLAYVNEGGTTAAPTGTGAPQEIYNDIPQDFPFARIMFYLIVALMVVIFIMASGLTRRVHGLDPEKMARQNKKLGTFNAIMFPIFLVLFFGGIIYEIGVDFAKRLPPPASDMGVSIEKLIIITTIITVPVFVLVHIALFLYPFFYRHKEGQKAYFYSHNDRLEFIWTSIPAVVLAGIILFGFKTWTKVTGDPEKNAEYVECYAYQFGWDFRYPGADKKLGKTDFLKIDPAKNLFGLDYSDVGTHDDFKSQELHLCVGREFVLKMRSRDVTHGGYLPHFRTQIYANPGMDNSVKFVPLFTTKQMREKLDKPNFNYEFACNQLCGAAHYTMRRIIVVDTPEDYEKWKAAQKPIYDGSQKTALK